MALLRIKDFDSQYAQILGSRDITQYNLYSDLTNERIGKVKDILVDEGGEFRYLIVDISFWIFGKEILLPIERTQFNFGEQRVYAKGLTKEQVKNLPQFDESLQIDNTCEENLRKTYSSYSATEIPDAMGNLVSPLVPLTPITIGSLASLAYPNLPPAARADYAGTSRTEPNV